MDKNAIEGIEIILKEYSDEVQKKSERIAREVAKETAQHLVALSRGKFGGTGKYADGWTSERHFANGAAGYVVRNKNEPGLTHLLEYGHVCRNQYGTWGRVPGRVHIRLAEQQANAKLLARMRAEL